MKDSRFYQNSLVLLSLLTALELPGLQPSLQYFGSAVSSLPGTN